MEIFYFVSFCFFSLSIFPSIYLCIHSLVFDSMPVPPFSPLYLLPFSSLSLSPFLNYILLFSHLIFPVPLHSLLFFFLLFSYLYLPPISLILISSLLSYPFPSAPPLFLSHHSSFLYFSSFITLYLLLFRELFFHLLPSARETQVRSREC